MTTTIAFLGLGAMGAPMAQNLVRAGFTVRVWNRNPARTAAIVGATAASTPADAARGAEFAITMLADDAAVDAVTLGERGIIAGLEAGAIHVGMSTVSMALCRRLEAAHAERGQRYVAAPVFGRPDAAAAGQLWIVPGGEARDLERLAGVFAALGQGTFPMPTAGQATLAKLLGNFMIAGTVEMLGEALAVAEKAGMEPERLLDMLTGTLFGTPVVKRYGALVAKTAWEPAGFAIPLGLKDVNLALEAAGEVGVPLRLAQLVRERLTQARAKGRDHYDWAGLASVIREEAGLPERK
ncbi:MAG: NAD(P)-dependent oxidoreductase [Gemmatimonadota bacterium]